MMELEIKASVLGGITIRSETYFVCPSYRPLMAYWPGERANRAVFAAAEEEALNIFGDRIPVAIVPPTLDQTDPQKPFLPSCRFTAQFHSTAVDESIDGLSLATLIWFQSSPWPIIGPDVADDFKDFDWGACSIDIATEDLI